MSKIKIGPNLFLQVAELRRLQQTLADWGYKRDLLLSTKTFGLVRDIKLPDLGNIATANCFEVTKAGTPIDTVVVNNGIAIDSNGDLIINPESTQIQILNNGQFFWIKISHLYVNNEVGTVSVDVNGNIIGTGTDFLNVLRGQPNYPSKIVFLNSNSNNNIYEVVKITNGTHAVLSGDFIAEDNLQFAIYGTFTPGYPVPSGDSKIFDYDGCSIELVPEDVLNTAPAKNSNIEFFIARVSFNGTDLTIEDKRNEYWNDFATDLLTSIDRTGINKLIGVESVKWDIASSPKYKNEINLTWGFRSNSYTIDPAAKKISILAGQGGVYKDTSFFTTGDFNGWRVYCKSGIYKNIISSVASGNQIIVTLDNLDINDYPIGELILLVPAVEFVEIKIKNDSSASALISQIEENFIFPINTPLAKIYARVPFDKYKYNLVYRYIVFENYSDWSVFPDDAKGYYDEASFDDSGNLKTLASDRTLKPYSGDLNNGFIELEENPFSYSDFVNKIDIGDLFGIEYHEFNSNDTVINLTVGKNRQTQIFKGSPFSLSNNIFINLNKFLDPPANTIPAKNGNTFYLYFKQKITQGSFKLQIGYDYQNNTINVPLRGFDALTERMIDGDSGLFIKCMFDGTIWICTGYLEALSGFTDFVNEVQFGASAVALDASGLLVSPIDPPPPIS